MPNSATECSGIYTYLGSTHVSYVGPSSVHISADDVGPGVPKPVPRGLYEVEVSYRYSHVRPASLG